MTEIKKIEFNEQPNLIEYEGAQVRINFDVETGTAVSNNGADGGEQEPRTIYLAYVVRMDNPLNEERVKEAVMAAGFPEFKADEVAALVMKSVMEGYGNESGILAYAKKAVIARISQYDISDAVNNFTFDAIDMWLPRELRQTLRQRFNDEKEEGLPQTNLVYGELVFTLPIDLAISLIKDLERYARQCYDQTARHKAAVLALDNVADVLAYDFTQGYPTQLDFVGEAE